MFLESSGQKQEGTAIQEDSPRLVELREEVGRSRTHLFNFIKKLLHYRDDDVAEDLTQSAMAKAIENIDKFRGDAQLFSWLSRIAMNETFAYLKTRQKKSALPLNEEVYSADSDRDADGEVLGDRTGDRAGGLDLVDLDRAIQKLPQDEQDIIRLLAIGHTPKEITGILNISYAATKSRVHRARERLSALYEKTAA